jgi:hypothetical protein
MTLSKTQKNVYSNGEINTERCNFKKQTKLPELKTSFGKIENMIEGINIRINQTEEIVNEFKHKLLGNI